MSYSKLETRPIWIYPKKDPKWLKTVINEFRIHPVTAQIFVSRNFTDLEEIHHFLYAKLPNLLNPNLFKDMDKAVNRIVEALHKKEKILVYGDNDVDGMSATALLMDFLTTIGASVRYLVPSNRRSNKNSMQDALSLMKAQGSTLLITVDCGITATKEIDEFIRNKIDVIVTDHHEPTSKIPHTVATLNPKLINSSYPNRNITGVGVAFKLAHALVNYFSKNSMYSSLKIDLKSYLDLVALGTIADMGALQGENRILVQYGLKQLRKTKRIGLRKLYNLCEIDKSCLSTIDISSKIAPRLNSLGRIADPEKGVELMLIKDEKEAEKLAKELDLYNIKRQKIERRASKEVDAYLAEHFDAKKNKAIVLSSKNWHPGIIAIIAARIAKQYNRPTVIVAIADGIGKGSIRTIPEYPILDVLKDHQELLLNFGGHDFAAGFMIEEAQLGTFKQCFIKDASRKLKEDDILTKILLDAEVNFHDLTFDFMESISLLEPFGNGNSPPMLYTTAMQTWPAKIIGQNHLKFFLEQNDRALEGIGFGMGLRKEELKKIKGKLKVCFTPQVNMYMKKASIQLQLRDFQ